MTVKDLLESVREQRYLYKAFSKDLEQAKRDIENIKAMGFSEKVQTSYKKDLSDVLIKLEEYIQKVARARDDLTELQHKAHNVLYLTNKRKMQTVIELWYIVGDEWKEIAPQVDLSEAGARKLRDEFMYKYGEIKVF